MYIAFDLGGTHLRHLIINNKESASHPPIKQPFIRFNDPQKDLEHNFFQIIDPYIDQLEGIGISLPANVDQETGNVVTWPNYPIWNGFSIKQFFNARYTAPVVFEDDANCGALGEASLMQTVDNLTYISIGTGVGCGLILNGELFKGNHGFAGELGHTQFFDDGDCICGNKGCVQAAITGRALVHRYNHAATAQLDSVDLVFARCHLGDVVAIACTQKFIQSLAKTIYNLVMLLDIDCVILGGGLIAAHPTIVERVRMDLHKKLHHMKRCVSLYAAQAGDYSSLYGAAVIIQKMNAIKEI